MTTPSDTGVTVDDQLMKKLSSAQKYGKVGGKGSVILCDPCTTEREQNIAVKYCVNCREHFCKGCADAHRKFKLFNGHSLSDISGNMSINKVKELVSIKCEKHPDRDVEIYCQQDNIYCCLICATSSHSECARLKETAGMETVAKKRVIDFFKKFELAEKHIDSLLWMQKQHIPELLRSKEKITEGLKRMKKQIVFEIDDIIDNFEEQTNQQLVVLNAESETNIENTTVLKVRCQKSREMIETLKEYGHPVQKVVSETKIAEEYYNVEKDMADEEQAVELVECSYSGLERLEGIHSELIKNKKDQVNIVRHARDFVKYEEVVSTTVSINVVKADEHNISLSGSYPRHRGITVISDTHLLLCDSYIYNRGNVCLYDIVSKTVKELGIDTPFSGAVLKNNPSHVAVSLPGEKKIHIVSIKGDELTIEKTFKCDKKPHGLVSLNNGHVGVTWDSPPSFDIVDLSGNEMKTVTSFTQDSTGRTFKSFEYVAVDELRSHIIQSCHKDDTVYCFDYSGNPVFEYTDPELKYPRGIDIDRDGNIYICSEDNDTLHVLTPSGCKVNVVKGMPRCPRVISFDETGERLWLTASRWSSNCDKVFLFSLVV